MSENDTHKKKDYSINDITVDRENRSIKVNLTLKFNVVERTTAELTPEIIKALIDSNNEVRLQLMEKLGVKEMYFTRLEG